MMRTLSDMDLELKTLRKRVRRLKGGDEQSAVSELVGTPEDPHLNPTRRGFANAVSQADRSSAAAIEEKAANFLAANPREAERFGIADKLRSTYPGLSTSGAMRLVEAARSNNARNAADNERRAKNQEPSGNSQSGRFISRPRSF